MSNADNYMKVASDWKMTSYGDITAIVGLGGRVMHLKFYSPSLKYKQHTFLLEVGAGAEFKLDFSVLSRIDKVFSNAFRAKESATAESNYKNLLCLRPFSAWDILGSQTVSVETYASSVFGIKAAAISVFSKGVQIFDISAEVSNVCGIGIGAAFTAGTIVGFGPLAGFGSAGSGPYSRQRYETEKKYGVQKPAGGFIM